MHPIIAQYFNLLSNQDDLNQTSADEDSESPDCSVLPLSGRKDRQRTENPDRIRTADRHRTGFTGKSGQKRDTDRAVRRRLFYPMISFKSAESA